ncbi:unnamed protein product [Thelazia callipaeda]|uniref:Haloacid dehalogenase-like hydrolase domain-containing protein 3 n=1 Tax=Thelazia callipaeda TaxID=103827 RepID=A0A0N5D5Y8_THECL|nr:unnamed protein product [Thelazia callipaeda]
MFTTVQRSLCFAQCIFQFSHKRSFSKNGALLYGKKVKVVTLDALNTLVRLQEPPGHTYAKFAKLITNVQYSGSDLNEAFERNFKKLSKMKSCYGYGENGEVEWWTELVKNCFADIGNKKIEINEVAHRLYEHYGTIKPWKLIDTQIHQHLKQLQDRSIRLGIISNFDKRLRNILDMLKLSPYFEVVLLSGEIGIEKPNKEIFTKAAKLFQITQMEEILHIGDDEEKDFSAARNAGARALLLDYSGQKNEPTNCVIYSLKELINWLQ